MREKHYEMYRSPLSRVRGMGSAHDGTKHWWMQRVTALALIPLSLWFICALLCRVLYEKPEKVAEWLSSPYASVAMVSLSVVLFFHGKLGLQLVIEDYVKCNMAKTVLLMLNNLLCVAGAVMTILAVLKLHLIAPVSYL